MVPTKHARGEDSVVLKSFFTDASGAPLRNGLFLEMGAYDGKVESSTWFMERCLRWRGVLAEGQPTSFANLLLHRPSSLNLRFAACERGAQAGGTANFTNRVSTMARVEPRNISQHIDPTRSPVAVECGSLGAILATLGVSRLDFVSVDVEGAESVVLHTLNFGTLSVGVLMVEVRGDGQRAGLLKTLLGRGFAYVGQIAGRPTKHNSVFDDVYVNATHLRTFMPLSRALSSLS